MSVFLLLQQILTIAKARSRVPFPGATHDATGSPQILFKKCLPQRIGGGWILLYNSRRMS